MSIGLDAHGYRLRLSPRWGATILSLDWQRSDGAWLALLEPLVDPAEGLRAGCFVMAPFANRIAGGRFDFADRSHRMALNRPEQRVAIHGFSRDRPWRAFEAEPDRVRLEQAVESGDHPWRYSARLDVTLAPDGAKIALSIRNEGREPLPFGIGLHPFFPRDADTMVTFAAEGHFATGPDGLPALPFQPASGAALGRPKALETLRGLDLCYRDWRARRLRLTWRERQLALDLEAAGALRHLHLFVPTERAVVCAEPVSHLPDAINRPELGASAMMTVLAPGESLAGALRLGARSLAGGA